MEPMIVGWSASPFVLSYLFVIRFYGPRCSCNK